MIRRARKLGSDVLDAIETLALCVVIALALALGMAEAAADSARGDEMDEEANRTNHLNRNP